MSALLDNFLGSLSSSVANDSEMSGSFQSGVGSADYDYGSGSGHSGVDRIDKIDHYGGHSGYHHHSGYGYHDEKCCPLVVDALCLAAVLGAIAGATALLQRTFQVELCRVNNAAVTLFVNNCRNGRRKRSDYDTPWWHGPLRRVFEGKNYDCLTLEYLHQFDLSQISFLEVGQSKYSYMEPIFYVFGLSRGNAYLQKKMKRRSRNFSFASDFADV